MRGGLRAAEEADVAGVVDIEAAGEGVDVSDISGLRSSVCMLATVPWASSVLLPGRVRDTSMLIEDACLGRWSSCGVESIVRKKR